MRTRTRDVVRMLATFRHATHCRRLRATAAAQAARDLVTEATPEDAPEDDERTDNAAARERRHSGMH